MKNIISSFVGLLNIVRHASLQPATAVMKSSLLTLRELVTKCKQNHSALVISVLKSDQSTEMLALDVGSGKRSGHMRSGWNTCFSRQKIIIAWSQADICEFPLVRLPVPTLNLFCFPKCFYC